MKGKRGPNGSIGITGGVVDSPATSKGILGGDALGCWTDPTGPTVVLGTALIIAA